MPVNPELERLLAIARRLATSRELQPRIQGDAVAVPFDVKRDAGGWTVEWELVRTRGELLEALGY